MFVLQMHVILYTTSKNTKARFPFFLFVCTYKTLNLKSCTPLTAKIHNCF